MARRTENKGTAEMVPRVEMADGTQINADAQEGSGDLWIWGREEADNAELARLAAIFAEKEKTKEIAWVYPGGKQVWKGYTGLKSIATNQLGKAYIRMIKRA